MKRRALLSVWDKTGVVEFARELENLGFEVVSTGGTLRALIDAGVNAVNVSAITGFQECLDGRVKTLHPVVHAGILAMRGNAEHMEQLTALGIDTIDVVAVNLYPFKQTIMKPNVELQDAIENIDIGGPTMLRAAAKNYQDVYVVCDPSDYAKVTEELKSGKSSLEFKFNLMYKVFQHTAVYDTLIANYMRGKLGIEFPEQITFAYEKQQDMRYGENPHQKAVFYRDAFPYAGSLTAAKQLNGKELSYNNINDTNDALDLLREYQTEPTVVAVKHANPCGVGSAKTIAEAYRKAYSCDPVSIFGGIVAANREIDKETAEELVKIFLEIVIAPSFTAEALEVLKKKANLRVLELPTINAPLKSDSYDMKKVVGGLLVQDHDRKLYDEADYKVVTKRAPTADELEQMKFAFKVVKHTKSNAIVLAKDYEAIGVGAGQTNRIWAAEQAIEHANGAVVNGKPLGERAKGAVMASDAFFPFSDCVEAAAKAGVTAIIQPGGSIRDAESVEACDKYGIAMVFVGSRHFKH